MPEAFEGLCHELAAIEGWLECRQNAPGLARKALRHLLRLVPGGSRFVDDGQLLVSELVTNAVRHGSRPGGRIWYGFKLYQDFLYLAVEDASAKPPVPRPATDQQETGRGLQLIEALAMEWGVGPGNGPGKRVWATYAPADPDAVT